MIDCSKTENYFIEKMRMTKRTRGEGCKIKCSECPLSSQNNGTSECMSCITFEMYYPQRAISIVQQWSDEHQQKTFVTEFLKHYPNIQLNNYGIPKWICPFNLGLMSRNDCRKNRNCVECWNQPIEESDLVESEKIDIKSNKA